jgi:hypothetical protein
MRRKIVSEPKRPAMPEGATVARMARPSARSRARRLGTLPGNDLIIPSERTHPNGRERSRQLDKLGVTGSSPVPPTLARGLHLRAFRFPGTVAEP